MDDRRPRRNPFGDAAAEGRPQGLRLIVLAGKPLGKPVVQYGPFVMKTREEIEQTLADYREGQLTGQGTL